MILRKPYAFLIKHFKLIHLIITIMIGYATFLMSDTLRYLVNNFPKVVKRADALNHIHYGAVVLYIISILAVGVIIWLMRYKNKPRMMYRIYIITYIAVLIISFLSFNTVNAIYTNDATLKSTKAVIDLLRISSWVQYYFIAFTLTRGLGFDVKKFNFAGDLEEFNIEKQDAEEIEVTISGDGGKLQRRGRRSLRELKYYYVENKYVINIILIAVAAIALIWIIRDRTVTNVVYNEGDSIASGKFTIGVEKTYITNTDSDGKKILENDDKLVIVKISAKTNDKYKYKLNTNYLTLEIGRAQFTPTNKYNNYFRDIGTIYKNQYLYNTPKNYILVFRIDKKSARRNMTFKYLGGLEGARNLDFNIDPIGVGNSSTVSSVKLNNYLKFDNSILGNTKLKIKEYQIQEKFEYNYCYLDNCNNKAVIDSSGNNILKLTIDSKIDDNIYIDKDWDYIINNYATIYYYLDNITRYSNIIYSKTPNDINDTIYIEVDKDIEKASKIWIEFNIRNQIYKYTLKES